MFNYKITEILDYTTLSFINDKTIPAKERYTFLKNSPFVYYFNINTQNIVQLVLSIKYNMVLDSLVYSFMNENAELLSPYYALSQGFLLSQNLYSYINANYNVFYYKNVFYLVTIECIDNLTYKSVLNLDKQNISMVLKAIMPPKEIME